MADAPSPTIQGQVAQGSKHPDLIENIPLQRGWIKWHLKVPSNPNYSIIYQHIFMISISLQHVFYILYW